MMGTEMILEILIGLTGIIGCVGIITAVVTRVNIKKNGNMRNIYLGKMSNTDLSIQEAMQYLKLTNGINVNLDGEKVNE